MDLMKLLIINKDIKILEIGVYIFYVLEMIIID